MAKIKKLIHSIKKWLRVTKIICLISAGITKGVKFKKSQRISKLKEILLLLESVLQKSEEGRQKNCTAWGLNFLPGKNHQPDFFVWMKFGFASIIIKQLNNRFTIHRMAILCLKNCTTPLMNCVHFQNFHPSPQIKPFQKFFAPLHNIYFVTVQYYNISYMYVTMVTVLLHTLCQFFYTLLVTCFLNWKDGERESQESEA